MSQVNALVLRNGFPFPIREFNENGEAFSEWDGSTVFTDPDTNAVSPSESTEKLITVYGENSQFCIPFTFAQLVEYWWRVKYFTLEFDSSIACGLAASAAKSATVDGDTETATASVELDTIDADHISYTAQTLHRDSKQNDSGDYYEHSRCLDSLTGDFQDHDGTSTTSSAFQVSMGDEEPDTEESSPHGYVFVTVDVLYSFIFTAFNPDGAPQKNFIKVNDNEYWFAPAPTSGDGDTFTCNSYAFAGGNANGVLGSVSESATFTSNTKAPTGTFTYDGFFPIEVHLASGTLTGTAFGIKNSTSATSGDTGGLSVTNPYFIPTTKIEATEWWGYGGRYNESTGALV